MLKLYIEVGLRVVTKNPDLNLFHANVPPHIETSKLVFNANQFTGFYMRGNIGMKKVKLLKNIGDYHVY